MARWPLLLLCALSGTRYAMPAGAAAPPERGAVIFQTDFESPDALRPWRGEARLDAGLSGGRAMYVERYAASKTPAAMVSIPLPADSMRGCRVYVSAMVKAQDVSAPPRSWNGIKLMLAIEAPSGRRWPQAEISAGTFDWRKAAMSPLIPPDATAVTLFLGLEQVTGRAWFDDVKVTVSRPPPAPATRPAGGPMYRGHELPRLRGAMVSPNIDDAGLRVLGEQWNANVIRWQLIRHARPGEPGTLHDYDEWLEKELAKLDAAAASCRKYGMYIVVDLHSPPGGKVTASWYIGSDHKLFTDRACQDKFVDVWKRIALRYRDNPVIWGYDLANEPVETLVEEDCDDWHALATRAARAIRQIDPRRAIIVEPPDWGGPAALSTFHPIDVPNVVYSVHMYIPFHFTHQGIHGIDKPAVYPGMIDNRVWDRSALEEALRPVVEFQKRYGVHIYIGEFSAIRWAPDNSACRYLKDVIDIFESQGWDWTYHAFREWHGWSVEHTEDRDDNKPATRPTDRQKLLREWFSRNRKPSW